MRKIILGMLLLLLPLVCFAQNATTQAKLKHEGQPLQLTIKSDKEVYEVGEEINLTVTLKSNSDKEMLVFWSDEKPSIIIKESGVLVVVLSNFSGENSLYIKPKESSPQRVTLTANLTAGKYQILLEYNPRTMPLDQVHKIGTDVWRGILTSNTITIKVVEKKASSSILPKSMKGYELYGWQVGDGWHFSLLPATNRLKTYGEVTRADVTLKDIAALKAELKQLSKNEYLFWSNWRIPGLNLPPEEIINEIQKYCDSLDVKLTL